MADGVLVVLGLHDRDRDAGFLIKDVVREFTFLLVSACNVPSDHHRARRECHLPPNLSHWVPPRSPNRWRDNQIADVALAKATLVHTASTNL